MIRASVVAAGAVWTLVVLGSLAWNYVQMQREARTLALLESRASLTKDLVYRRWAAQKGGVYVPVTDDTPPNPYLEGIPHRDIETDFGVTLTLANPAYMTRQVQELGHRDYGTRGHITSLRPLRPENAPDPWERAALESFSTGGTDEIASVDPIGNAPFARYIHALVAEESCLKCHARQGYQIGDIIGGLSVSTPLAPYQAALLPHWRAIAAGHVLLWLLGLSCLGIATRRFCVLARLRGESIRALSESEERLALALAGADVGTWDWNVAAERVDFAVHSASLLGYEPAQLPTQVDSWKRLIHPADLGSTFDTMRRHFAGDVEHFECELRVRHKDGQWVWVLGRGRVSVRDGDGRPLRVCGTIIDIGERKRVEAALAESEGRFRMLFDNMRSGVALYRAVDDGADFEFVDMNAAGLALGKVEKQAIVGRRVTEVFPGIVEIGLLPLMKRVWRTGRPEALPLRKYRDDQIEQWVENYVVRLPSGFVAALYEDTSAERQAQQALRESEAHYRHLIEAMPDILYRLSPGKGIVYASPQIRRVLGFDPMDRHHAGRWYDAIHPEDKPLVDRAVAAMAVGKRYDIEYRIQDADGAWHWFRDRAITCQRSGDELLVEGIATDITEHKQADAERERLSRAIEQADEVVVITDREGAIQYVNPAFERVTGYSREEAIGLNPRMLKSGVHDESFYRALWETLAQGRTWEGQIVNKRKDGTLFTEEVTISPVHDAKGNVINYVAVKRDVTAHLQLSEEKRQIEEQFRQAQKMEAIGQLAGGVAHDFNNLLQVITGYADLASTQLGGEHPATGSLREVVKASERAANLVGQLLAFSRRQVMRPEDLDLNELVRDLMKMLGRIIGEHIRLEFVQGHSLAGVHADRGMLEQVLVNLCVNARDAMPEGGVLTIQTCNAEIDDRFRAVHPWAKPGRYVCLQVRDTGFGMSEEIRERLFEPFFTTKEVGKGTGLGLSMVYGIVKQHGGAITCVSEEGLGATFSVFLPRGSAAHSESAPETGREAPGGTETILIVEDDAMVRELSESILVRAGYSVMTAEDGEVAVNLFEQHAAEIDLVLLDVVMPNMGGKDAYDRIQAIRPGVPAVFASGYSENIVHKDFVLDGRLTLIQKPFSRRSLLCTIRAALDQDPALAQLPPPSF